MSLDSETTNMKLVARDRDPKRTPVGTAHATSCAPASRRILPEFCSGLAVDPFQRLDRPDDRAVRLVIEVAVQIHERQGGWGWCSRPSTAVGRTTILDANQPQFPETVLTSRWDRAKSCELSAKVLSCGHCFF
jgi:hypothetical protein